MKKVNILLVLFLGALLTISCEGEDGINGIDGVDGERHVLRRDRRPVMEGCPLHQVKRHGQFVFRDLPAFRQIGLRVPAFIVTQRGREQLRARLTGGGARLHGGVQVPRRLLDCHDQRPTLLGLLGDNRCERPRGHEGRRGKCE